MQPEQKQYTGPIHTKYLQRKSLKEPYTPPGSPSIKSPPIKLLNDYLRVVKIGEGPLSQIKLMYHLKEKKYYAMKKYNLFIMKKKIKMTRNSKTGEIQNRTMADQVSKEIEVWSLASKSEYVARLHEIIEDQEEEKIYLIMEFCEKGDIAEWDSKNKIFRHDWNIIELADLFYQAAKGLAELHQLNIVHRDIKPLNLLVTAQNKLKIVDFGLSVILQNAEEKLAGTVGTYHFNSPQMLTQKEIGGYDGRRSDVWALGVSFFSILFGYLPFYHELEIKLFDMIEEGKYKIPQSLDEGAKLINDVITKMLQVESKDRITAREASEQLEAIYKKLVKKQNKE